MKNWQALDSHLFTHLFAVCPFNTLTLLGGREDGKAGLGMADASVGTIYSSLCFSVQKCEGRKEPDREVRKNTLGRENSRYKGPEVRTTG